MGRNSFGIVRPELFYSKEKATRPSPQIYRIKSGFKPRTYAFEKQTQNLHRSESVKKNLAVRSETSFGAGREAYNKVVGANKYNHQQFDPALPGPGFYTPRIHSACRQSFSKANREKCKSLSLAYFFYSV